jgi:hypothetical protein
MFDQYVQRGTLRAIDNPAVAVVFQFNPVTLSDNKTAIYADRSVLDVPGKVFTGAGPRTISFDLKLHGLEPNNGGIPVVLAKLRSFIYPVSDPWENVADQVGRVMRAPSTCVFTFGSRTLDCIVTDLKVTETQFNEDLETVQADVSITLQVIEGKDNTNYIADGDARRKLAKQTLGLDYLPGRATTPIYYLPSKK